MEDYSRALLRSSVALICKELGHLEVEESAFVSLTEIMQLCKKIFPFISILFEPYLNGKIDIEEVGYRSHKLTEESPRTDSNFFDVTAALEEMGCSNTEIEEYIKNTEEIQFKKPYASYPIQKKRKDQSNENKKRPMPNYVPDFLPQFPEERTYHTTVTKFFILSFLSFWILIFLYFLIILA